MQIFLDKRFNGNIYLLVLIMLVVLLLVIVLVVMVDIMGV
jgi:hypothetical protein